MSVNKNFNQSSSPTKVDEDYNQKAPLKVIEKQGKGIVSILGSDCARTKAAAANSLRRTLSADMSSKKWLQQNGFCPMKKIASSEELQAHDDHHHHSSLSSSSTSSSEGEEEYEGKIFHGSQDYVWRSIQSQKERNGLEIKPQPVWSWGSILTQKGANEDSSNLPPPYIHPLVKRSASSLTDKSLQICTESLGSETGSDGFSSYSASEAGDVEGEREDAAHQQQQLKHEQQQSDDESLEEEFQFVKYNYSHTSRKMGPRSFPPPLPSLAGGGDGGASLHMHCHRQNGRFFLEAVSVPSQNYFHAERQDGRLLLTLVNNNNHSSKDGTSNEEVDEDDQMAEEYDEQVFDDIEEVEGNELAKFEDGYEDEDEEEGEGEEEDEEFEKENIGRRREIEYHVIEQNSKLSSCGVNVINVHKSALMMKKLMGLDNKNLTWASPKFNKGVNFEEEEEEESDLTSLPQSLPPPPRVARLISAAAPATAASFNAYEYFWRDKPSMASIIKPIPEECTTLKNNNNYYNYYNKVILKGHEQQNLVLMAGNKADYLVPLLRRCNEPKRSLLLWEPYCIATS